jgi:RimJ/RimL family protein N-acetyltransferase
MGDSERLSYEKLNADNCEQLVALFEAEGENPYIDKRFQSIDAVKKYTQDLDDSRFEAKYGSCDFLIKLQNTNTYIGVLHLFDYNIEVFLDMSERCTIGFAIAAPFRCQYYATEALKNLFQYAYANHGKKKFLAYTPLQNEPSNAFLRSLDMSLENEEYHYGGERSNYYVWWI